MGVRLTKFAPGEFYHVYNRGNSKQCIFLDQYDYQRFQKLLYISNSIDYFKVREVEREGCVYETSRAQSLVAISAYCLMPNHFHILLTPIADDGVSLFMKKLGTGYAMYFNKKYDRTGSLFEGKFKAEWANTDVYLRYLYAYIHLNPAKLFLGNDKDHLQKIINYPYSSYQDYCTPESRRESAIVDVEKFPYTYNNEDLHKDIQEWYLHRKDLCK